MGTEDVVKIIGQGDNGVADVDSDGRINAATEDIFTDGEVLSDKTGDGSALTFTFSSPVQLVWVRADGADARADPFGGTPASDTGIICEDGIPNPLTIQTDTVQVWAPNGTNVNVYGFRY